MKLSELKVGQTVTWTSQAGGHETRKVGRVVHVSEVKGVFGRRSTADIFGISTALGTRDWRQKSDYLGKWGVCVVVDHGPGRKPWVYSPYPCRLELVPDSLADVKFLPGKAATCEDALAPLFCTEKGLAEKFEPGSVVAINKVAEQIQALEGALDAAYWAAQP